MRNSWQRSESSLRKWTRPCFGWNSSRSRMSRRLRRSLRLHPKRRSCSPSSPPPSEPPVRQDRLRVVSRQSNNDSIFFTMKVLVADKFEKSGLDGLKAAGCEVTYEPDAKDDVLTDAVRKSA